MQLIKAFVVGLVMIIPLAGCSENKDEQTIQSQTQSNKPSPSKPMQNEVQKSYEKIVNDYIQQIPLEKKGSEVPLEDQQKFVDKMKNLYRLKATSETIFSLYEEGITKLSPSMADKFTAYAIAGMRRNSFEDYKLLEKTTNKSGFLERFFKAAETYQFKYMQLNRNEASVQDKDVRQLINRMQKQGYYLASTEGMLYPLVDFTRFANHRAYNTKGMANLLQTLAVDDLEPLTADASLNVSVENLAARTYTMETMLKDFSGEKFEKYLAVRFRDHMNMLFFGVENSPAFDFTSKELKQEFLEEFKRMKTMEDSLMAEMAKDYLLLMEENQFTISDDVRKKAVKILEKIDDAYDLHEKMSDDYGEWMSGNISDEEE